jgi:thiosulfate dehydrogenase [quinone] large subunit
MTAVGAQTRARRAPRHAAVGYSTVREHEVGEVLWGLTRVAIGFVFFWAFLDKLFGLGRGTPHGKAWIDGVSPTKAYLDSLNGTFASFFHRIAGQGWADWLFMIGLCGIGLALILGIGVWIAAVTGTLLLGMMWLAALPIASNPFVDDHVIYALVILAVAFSGEGLRYGLGNWWRNLGLVERLPWLK